MGKKDPVVQAKTRTEALLSIPIKKHSELPPFSLSQAKLMVTLPLLNELQDRIILYPLLKPFAYAKIKYDNGDNAIVYHVIEPKLTLQEEQYLKKMQEGLIQIIDVSLEDVRSEKKVLDFIEKAVRRLIGEYGLSLSLKEYYKIMYYIFRDFVGLNRIEALLNDPYIEDIGCDGLNVPIYVVHKRYGSLKTNVIYTNEDELKDFVVKLAERTNRYISYAEPLLDGTLPDGTRIQATLTSDVTARGPTFSIRKFKDIPFTPIDMIRLNTASPEMLAYLWFVAESGVNIIITGGVSTGKTSFLNNISLFIPDDAKIISIEDTRELNLPHENWIPSVARIGFTGTDVGEVTMFQLLKESFRQNPDYLIVGEVRGKEAYVMFQGMASGHPSIATMHSGGIEDLIKRLETSPINLSPGLVDSLDLVIVMMHARERGKSARRVKEMIEIENVDAQTGKPRTTRVFSWKPTDDTFEFKGTSWLLERISAEKGIPLRIVLQDIARRKRVIDWLFENNVTNVKEITKYINLYAKNPEKFLSQIGERKEVSYETNFNRDPGTG